MDLSWGAKKEAAASKNYQSSHPQMPPTIKTRMWVSSSHGFVVLEAAPTNMPEMRVDGRERGREREIERFAMFKNTGKDLLLSLIPEQGLVYRHEKHLCS